MNRDTSHDTTAHYGIRTVGPTRNEYKLIYYYADGLGIADNDKILLGSSDDKSDTERIREWELFDLSRDPFEMVNEFQNPEYSKIVKELKEELAQIQKECGDTPQSAP
jgi:FMN phosphatase YigB (HAD superfamily)